MYMLFYDIIFYSLLTLRRETCVCVLLSCSLCMLTLWIYIYVYAICCIHSGKRFAVYTVRPSELFFCIRVTTLC